MQVWWSLGLVNGLQNQGSGRASLFSLGLVIALWGLAGWELVCSVVTPVRSPENLIRFRVRILHVFCCVVSRVF